MYVKLLFGPFAGEVKDLANEAAMRLLEDGQASRAFEDDAPLDHLAEPCAATISASTHRKAGRK